MKFRGVIINQHHMKNLLDLSLIFSKITRECVLIIEPERICFIVSEEMTQLTPFLWCETKKHILFSQYTMSGVSDEHNKIVLSINPTHLATALSPVKDTVFLMKIKLTKKEFPCLTVEIEVSQSLEDPNNDARGKTTVVHDVPVLIVPIEDWHVYKIPAVPESNLSAVMPLIKSMKPIVDKFKNISPYLICCITNKGELSFVTETDLVTIATQFKKLEIDYYNPPAGNDNTMTEHVLEIACRIDIKKILVLLASIQFQPYKLTCNVVEDYLIRVCVYFHEEVVLNCIIPAINE